MLGHSFTTTKTQKASPSLCRCKRVYCLCSASNECPPFIFLSLSILDARHKKQENKKLDHPHVSDSTSCSARLGSALGHKHSSWPRSMEIGYTAAYRKINKNIHPPGKKHTQWVILSESQEKSQSQSVLHHIVHICNMPLRRG